MAKIKQSEHKESNTIGSLVQQVLTEHKEPSVTEKSIKNAMNIKALFESVGLVVTDEQVDRLSTSLTCKGVKSAGKVTYSHGQIKIEPATKLALQARIAMECLQDGDNLATWAERLAADSRFVSKQSPATIISYYQKSLVDQGFLNKVV